MSTVLMLVLVLVLVLKEQMASFLPLFQVVWCSSSTDVMLPVDLVRSFWEIGVSCLTGSSRIQISIYS